MKHHPMYAVVFDKKGELKFCEFISEDKLRHSVYTKSLQQAVTHAVECNRQWWGKHSFRVVELRIKEL